MKHKMQIALVVLLAIGLLTGAATLVNLTNQVTGTLPHGNGGTDVTSPGTSGNVLTSNGTSWVSSALTLPAQPYVIATFYEPLPAASQVLSRHIPPIAVTIPSGCTNSVLKLGTAATASTTYTLNKNGSSFGTAVVSAGGTTASFTCASGPFTFNGTTDMFTLTAPGTADATAAQLTFSLYGTR